MKEKKGQPISAYVNTEVYNKFKTICIEKGLKTSPVIELLMLWFIEKQDEI